ncbi:MAG: ZIP family metal transporter [Clostridiales bacterium]|jgi:ZIP family zinc transporter|nr:ZIP family metal transporter [Clostridiales bacterium]
MAELNPLILALAGTGITFAGTIVGASLVFFTRKEINQRLQKLFMGLAAGVMLAAAVWSLLIPAIDLNADDRAPWLPAAAGFLAGGAMIFAFDKISAGKQKNKPNGLQKNTDSAGEPRLRTSKLIFTVTMHNFPEGMAVGLSCALAGTQGAGASIASAIMLAIGVAVQNIPEGAIIALPLRSGGSSKKRSFLYGVLSGAVEPAAGVFGAALIMLTSAILPWMLAIAAGAMIYVVVDELVPSAREKYTKVATAGAMLGFVLMMILDVMCG